MVWGNAKMWRRIWSGLMVLPALLILPTYVVAAPASTILPTEPVAAEQKVAAYHAEPVIPSMPLSIQPFGNEVRGRVAEARKILLELQAFVDKAARAVALGKELKLKRRENDRLKKSLLTSQAERNAFEHNVDPTKAVVAALTRTIVRNWLETVRLKNRSDDAHRHLIASESSWLAIEQRVNKLKRTLVQRRAELLVLRTEHAALSVELGRTRQEIAQIDTETQHMRRQQRELAARTRSLRRNVTAKLRMVLLENNGR